ncbi:MAG TPA: hypothetical protein VGP18_12590 [Solirubrobacteraceae bacterium]|jgi:hypothetical protein|nr:hypothetical protein [Solirubrobacteraceae bacterium]
MTEDIGRVIVYEDRFDAEAAAIDNDIPRMDEALRYVENVLKVAPEFGLRTDEPLVWMAPIVFPGLTSSGAEAASIFYTFDDERVRCLSIRRDW